MKLEEVLPEVTDEHGNLDPGCAVLLILVALCGVFWFTIYAVIRGWMT